MKSLLLQTFFFNTTDWSSVAALNQSVAIAELVRINLAEAEPNRPAQDPAQEVPCKRFGAKWRFATRLASLPFELSRSADHRRWSFRCSSRHWLAANRCLVLGRHASA